jgi:hypothetical protein
LGKYSLLRQRFLAQVALYRHLRVHPAAVSRAQVLLPSLLPAELASHAHAHLLTGESVDFL